MWTRKLAGLLLVQPFYRHVSSPSVSGVGDITICKLLAFPKSSPSGSVCMITDVMVRSVALIITHSQRMDIWQPLPCANSLISERRSQLSQGKIMNIVLLSFLVLQQRANYASSCCIRDEGIISEDVSIAGGVEQAFMFSQYWP